MFTNANDTEEMCWGAREFGQSLCWWMLRLLGTGSAATSLLFAQQQPLPGDHKPQSATAPSAGASKGQPATENWNLCYQATSIGQYHGSVHSPSHDPNSRLRYQDLI